MVDLLEIGAGRIAVRDTDGTVTFDTDEKLFIVTDFVSGSLGLSAQTAHNNNFNDTPFINLDTNHAISAINASADTVRGAFSVTTSGGAQGLHALGWFNATGTYIHYLGDINGALGNPTGFALVAQLAAYTFQASGGFLTMNERVRLKSKWSTSPGVTTTVTLFGVTIDYKLFCGTFV